jgi:hypothetical protein
MKIIALALAAAVLSAPAAAQERSCLVIGSHVVCTTSRAISVERRTPVLEPAVVDVEPAPSTRILGVQTVGWPGGTNRKAIRLRILYEGAKPEWVKYDVIGDGAQRGATAEILGHGDGYVYVRTRLRNINIVNCGIDSHATMRIYVDGGQADHTPSRRPYC